MDTTTTNRPVDRGTDKVGLNDKETSNAASVFSPPKLAKDEEKSKRKETSPKKVASKFSDIDKTLRVIDRALRKTKEMQRDMLEQAEALKDRRKTMVTSARKQRGKKGSEINRINDSRNRKLTNNKMKNVQTVDLPAQKEPEKKQDQQMQAFKKNHDTDMEGTVDSASESKHLNDDLEQAPEDPAMNKTDQNPEVPPVEEEVDEATAEKHTEVADATESDGVMEAVHPETIDQDVKTEEILDNIAQDVTTESADPEETVDQKTQDTGIGGAGITEAVDPSKVEQSSEHTNSEHAETKPKIEHTKVDGMVENEEKEEEEEEKYTQTNVPLQDDLSETDDANHHVQLADSEIEQIAKDSLIHDKKDECSKAHDDALQILDENEKADNEGTAVADKHVYDEDEDDDESDQDGDDNEKHGIEEDNNEADDDDDNDEDEDEDEDEDDEESESEYEDGDDEDGDDDGGEQITISLASLLNPQKPLFKTHVVRCTLTDLVLGERSATIRNALDSLRSRSSDTPQPHPSSTDRRSSLNVNASSFSYHLSNPQDTESQLPGSSPSKSSNAQHDSDSIHAPQHDDGVEDDDHTFSHLNDKSLVSEFSLATITADNAFVPASVVSEEGAGSQWLSSTFNYPPSFNSSYAASQETYAAHHSASFAADATHNLDDLAPKDYAGRQRISSTASSANSFNVLAPEFQLAPCPSKMNVDAKPFDISAYDFSPEEYIDDSVVAYLKQV
ncbi:uncharacterized protein BYT42DRAFT_559022 [Radiomyces spectabilis]|uniref:uncharacterized protein n=1 Tax=Radiomyces spectabilis TaxID=64574 RepID=UPI0022202002|nr:uncharacterized protein BYT42DRAFT_559022 [Radiomyces spectabilis]KAI8388124.1 hypothetical protein BYT42DRAFT_559022 [Radiomyces spectabilis]